MDDPNQAAIDDAERRAAKYRAEAVAPPPPPRKTQEQKDAEMRKKEEKAPTTRTDMGKRFARGGGVETRGKTKGRFV